MEPTTRHEDGADRLQVVDVRLGAGQGRVDLSGGLAGVLTDRAERGAAARWIATTVMGPPIAAADGSGEAARRSASSRTLLPPSAPAVLHRDDLRAQWQSVCAARRDELAATHASRRLERHRIEAALERARARLASVAVATPAAPAVSEAVRLHVHSLLRAIDALVPVPSFEALQLADDWDEHTALFRARAADPGVDIEAAERRVSAARIALATSSSGMTAEARAEIDRCHRAVVAAEAEMFDAKRKERPQAAARYEAAVVAENRALADAGVGSYAGFLFAITGNDQPLDTDARRAAQSELASATAALDAVRRGARLPSDTEFHARGVELRAHAERLLRHVVVDGDPPAELRALRIEAPARAERVRLLTDALRAAGVAVQHDAVGSARALLASNPPAAARPQEPAAGSGGLESLERQQAQNERSLAGLEAEIARLDAAHAAGVGGVASEDVGKIIGSLLDAYRAGNALGGRMPVVFDGVFEGLAPDARHAALLVLAQNTDLQSIVVTDDLQVMKSVAQAGGSILLWTEPPAPERGSLDLRSDRSSEA